MIEPSVVILSIVRSIVLLLGLTIAYLSYRAYRRTGSRYLRHAALGFAIVAFGVFIEGLLFELFRWNLVTVHIIESVLVACGFGVILYSLVR